MKEEEEKLGELKERESKKSLLFRGESEHSPLMRPRELALSRYEVCAAGPKGSLPNQQLPLKRVRGRASARLPPVCLKRYGVRSTSRTGGWA